LAFAATALVGGMMVVACWVAFTLSATHRVYLTPQRVPTHNMVMGFDTETDGFGTGPGSPLDELYRETDGPLAVAAAQVKAHPAEVANLLVRRPERMWALPWNDLRRTFLGVPAICLVWWHQLLLITGLLGALAVISQPDSSTTGGYSSDA